MIDLTENNFLYFYSTIAQVFGAILGLIGLTYVRRKEDISANIEEFVSSLMRHLKAIKEEVKEKHPDKFEPRTFSNVTIGALEEYFKPYRKDISDHNYNSCVEACEGFEREMKKLKKLSKAFRLVCYQLVTSVMLGIIGLGVSYKYPGISHIIISGIVLLFSITVLINSCRFFLLVDDDDLTIIRLV